MREDTGGPPHHQELPIALRVIRTSDLRERLRIQRPAIDIALSPDGQYLLAGTAQFGERERSNPGGLFVFETTQFKQVARLESGRFVVVHGFSPDGRYASISSSNGEDAPRTVIKVLDLQRLEVIAEKEFVSRHVEFIAIPRRL
ncbi:MAG: hypothetical protein KatS3mg057_1109 [Herpetosiphonaceae bacterium]|nr:MAG: hypothetical protein KatS3mg057_1109 [Herpetosiphonaceae bacterium]